MENVIDALKIAFAVLVFAIALTVAFSVIAQAKSTADAVLAISNKYDNHEFVDSSKDNNANKEERIVGFETILPVIYRYAKEQYAVTIVQNDGTPIVRYDLYTEGFMGNWNTINKKVEPMIGHESLQRGSEWTRYCEVKDRISKVDEVIKEIISKDHPDYPPKENAIWNAIGNVDTSEGKVALNSKDEKKSLYAGVSDNNSGISVVAPWMGNPNQDSIERIKADFMKTENNNSSTNLKINNYEKDGLVYFGKDLYQYKDNAFKEVFLEVQTNGETVVETDDKGNVEYSLDTIIGNKKLEIIYIMQ